MVSLASFDSAGMISPAITAADSLSDTSLRSHLRDGTKIPSYLQRHRVDFTVRADMNGWG